MKLLKITTVYDRTCYVGADDWAKGMVQTPLRYKTGRLYGDMPIGLRRESATTIHRENVAKGEEDSSR